MNSIEQKRIVFFILIFILSYGWAEEQHKIFDQGKVVFSSQRLVVNIEVATTKLQRTLGLMFRNFLPKNEGMLFVFEQQTFQKIWMKNTLIPLDVIFISGHGKIVSIIKGLQPCTEKSCEIYESAEKAKYMLEINQGIIERNKIEVGQEVLLFL